MICQVCGKEFESGNDPMTGIPNGVGLSFGESDDAVFTVCSSCIINRYEDVITQANIFKQDIPYSDLEY